MKKDPKFTEELQAFLATPENERDYAKGNMLLLQLSNNQIRFNNFARCPERKAEFINYQLKKYLSFRLADLTHEQVNQMEEEVEKIDKHLGLDKDGSAFKKANEEFKAGKRADHDTLPEDVQALYAENLSILQKMRELHMQLRSLSVVNSPCPDSERYPFLKELIALDKKIHDNWQTYDYFVPSPELPKAEAGQTEDTQPEEGTQDETPPAEPVKPKAKTKKNETQSES